MELVKFVNLRDILPINEISKKFSKEITFEEKNLKDIKEIERNKPHDMFQVGITVWDRYCNKNLDQDKFIFTKECGNNDPKLHSKIEKITKTKSIIDLIQISGFLNDPKLADNHAVEFIAAVIPNDTLNDCRYIIRRCVLTCLSSKIHLSRF